MQVVLECLRKHGQRLDLEIAQETGMALTDVHVDLDALAKAGTVIVCKITRFQHGRRIEALQCRIAGHLPRSAPGRKPT
jgi:transcription initiation factor IIE alpha subunit